MNSSLNGNFLSVSFFREIPFPGAKCNRGNGWTVHRPGPLLRIVLRAAILHEFQINLGGGGGGGGGGQIGRKQEK